MIRAPGIPGVVFGSLADGDGRLDKDARDAIAKEFDISDQWATIDQVHGAAVVPADRPGHFGEADGLFTSTEGLPIVVATADCAPVALVADGSVGLVHAGWRGVAAKIVAEAVSLIAEAGHTVKSAVIGPHIGPCCYEVGQEVVDAISGYASMTTWGAVSVDLDLAIRSQLPSVEVISIKRCTMDDLSYASHRRDATPHRQIAIAWIP